MSLTVLLACNLLCSLAGLALTAAAFLCAVRGRRQDKAGRKQQGPSAAGASQPAPDPEEAQILRDLRQIMLYTGVSRHE